MATAIRCRALFAAKGRAAPEAERAYARARELCQRVGDPPELFRVLWGLWVVYLSRAQLKAAYELAEQLLRRAQSVHDPGLLLLAQRALGNTSFRIGELLLAKEHLEMAISLYDPERHRLLAFSYGGTDQGVNCLSFAAMTLWQLGYPDRALERGNEALALARTLSHPFSLAPAEYYVGVLRQFRREARAAQETAERVIAFSAERGFPDYLVFATSLRGWAMCERGRDKKGIAQLQQGLAAIRATGAEQNRPCFLCLLAEACGGTGRFDDGQSALTEAPAAADEHETHFYEPEMHRLKGELLLKQDDSKASEAQSCFEKAIEIAREQSAKSWELRATTSLARLLAKRGHRDEARAMLAEIYGWFTEGFDTADLKEAKALLDELT